MITPSLKPDFHQTLARFEAWWECEIVDRPPVTLYLAETRDAPAADPADSPAGLRRRWLDVDTVVKRHIEQLEATTWLGDTVPGFYANVGPDLTATLWGVELECGRNTSWARAACIFIWVRRFRTSRRRNNFSRPWPRLSR